MDYQEQSEEYVQMLPDYKAWSIINIVLSVIFCCSFCGIASLILSILALVKGNDVNKYVAQGEAGLVSAQEASKNAKMFNLISSILLALCFVGCVIYAIVYFFILMGTTSSRSLYYY